MTNKTVIVTGVTSGIGLATAGLLAQSGYRVVGVGRSPEKVATLSPDLQGRYGKNAIDLQVLDVRDTAAVKTFVANTLAQHGKVDALVNAAGVLKFENTHEVSEESFDAQFDTLFKGPFFLTMAVLPSMMAAGGGTIINIASVVAEKASPKMAVYAAAKAALVNLTKSLALEYADKKIRALCVSPGAVQTGLMDKIMFAMIQKRTPMKRLAQAAEIAALVHYLLSEEASFMTGSTITIDGGAAL
jgi:3-oxoacyl-[acyl-carrier protein] reductase/meso-butanediol dehydrogenase/(S,S)-butanediol dehydrogenase/diacetyl reductase